MIKLLKRLWSLLIGQSQIETDEAVKNNTDAAYAAKIEELTQKNQRLRVRVREVKGIEFDYSHQIETLKKEKVELEKYLDMAVDQENHEAGQELLEKIAVVDRDIADKTEMYESYKQQANKLSELLKSSSDKLDELKRERTTAKSYITLSETIKELDTEEKTSAADANLDVAREAVKAARFQSEADMHALDNSPKATLDKFKNQAIKTSSKTTMAELIAKKRAAQAATEPTLGEENIPDENK